MTLQSVDPNLLLGALAFQSGYISRTQLKNALEVCRFQPALAIGQVLLESDAITPQQLQHLNELQIDTATPAVQEALLAETAGEMQDPYATIQPEGPGIILKNSPPPVAEEERFRAIELFAKGGLGEVYIAEDDQLRRQVALKRIQEEHADDPQNQARFLIEAEITGALEHPGIVPVYGLGRDEQGRPFYAMRLIWGKSLQEAIEAFHENDFKGNQRTYELRKLLRRLLDVCNAVEYAHSRGVVHRDLKPSNVMLGEYGETLVVDWGLAKVLGEAEPQRSGNSGILSGVDSHATAAGSIVGTPGFMSPEQAEGNSEAISPASDIYSLGATLYFLLTGQAPFASAEQDHLLDQIIQGKFDRPAEIAADISPALESICLKAMALKPADRYNHVVDFAEDLDRYLADAPVSAHVDSLTQKIGRWSRRHWQRAAVGVSLAFAAILLLAFLLVNHARENEAVARQLVERTRLFDLELLEHRQQHDLSPQQVVKLDDLLARVEEISPKDADFRRQQLFDAYVAVTRRLLDKPRFSEEDHQAYALRVENLEARARLLPARYNEVVVSLENELQHRLQSWDSLLHLEAPFQAIQTELFDPPGRLTSDARVTRGGNGEYGIDPTVLTTTFCPNGAVELEAWFDRTWTDVPVVGLVLNCRGQERYDFLVSVHQFDFDLATPSDLVRLPTIEKSLANLDDPLVEMTILKNGKVLRRTPVKLEAARLHLVASRDGGLLRLTVNSKHVMEIVDPFPLTANAQGRFGIFWPPGVNLEGLIARGRRRLHPPSPLERGDAIFALGNYEAAREIYLEMPENLESQYKAAVCSYLQYDDPAVFAQFERLAAICPADMAPQQRQWQLLAAMHVLRQQIIDQNWNEVNSEIDRLSQHYDLGEISRLAPDEQRQLILQEFSRGGDRFRIAYQREEFIRELHRLTRLDRLFNEDGRQRRQAMWRLADVYRLSDRRPEAIELAHSILEDSAQPQLSAREQTALVSDLVWMLILEHRFSDALDAVNKRLLKPASGSSGYAAEYLPLLIDRARIYHAQGEIAAATRDIDTFLTEVDVKSVSHSEYADACLLRGFLYEEENDFAAAKEVWLWGARRRWHEGYLEKEDIAGVRGMEMQHANDSLVYDAMIASLTGELTQDETIRMMENYLLGTGLGSIVVRGQLPDTLPPSFTRKVIAAHYQTARGKKFARRMVLRECSLREYHVMPLMLLIHQSLLQSAFEYETVPAKLDNDLMDGVASVLESFNRGELRIEDIPKILELWKGKYSRRSWQSLSGQLQPEVVPTVALVIGQMYLNHDRPEVARDFFRAAARSPHATPAVRSRAQARLENRPLPAEEPEEKR